MISKRHFFLSFLLLPLLIHGEDPYFATRGETSFLRPVLFRSEFVSRGTLNVLRNNSMKAGYDLFGYPQFSSKDIVFQRPLRFWETNLAQSKNYSYLLNKEYADYILKHPEKFHPDTIARYKAGKYDVNPRLRNGETIQWHHDRDKYLGVTEGAHRGKPHVGGAKQWGFKYAEAAKKLPGRELILTAHRWGKFAALDFAFSSMALAASGKTNWQDYAVNFAAATSAGAVAWGVESLLISCFPLLQGSTSLFIAGCALNLGGPAAWIASAAFSVTKFSIMYGWDQHQIQTAKQVEAYCREGEKQLRFRNLKKAANENTEKLKALLSKN